MRIRNERDGAVLADSAEMARGFAGRLVGLIGRRGLPKGSALMIPGCRQVHTFLMRFPIDVVFVDAENHILCAEPDVKPYSITRYCKGATSAIELPAGTIADHGVRIGDRLVISEE